jgi:hypothetical protein
MKNSLVAVCFTLALMFGHTPWTEAFTIILKNGKTVEGSWHSEDASVIRIRDKSGIVLTFNKNVIDWRAMAVRTKTPAAAVSKQTSSNPKVVSTTPAVKPKIPATTAPVSGTLGRATDTLRPPQPKIENPPSGRRWSLNATVASIYDTNIDHNEDSTDSVGVAYGAGIRLRNRSTDPTFFFDYEVARHNYSNTDRWDRISQNFRATHLIPINDLFAYQTVGEVSLKGSSEDRELSDQYIVRPTFSYEMTRNDQFEFYAAYRIRRYDENPDRNAINRYAGLDFEHEFGDHEVEVGYRYEYNNSDDPDADYYRKTFSIDYTIPWRGENFASFEVKHRRQNYVTRMAEIEVNNGPDLEELRFDRRWVFSAEVGILIDSHIELVPTYEYEIRFSNDVEKEFSAHQPRVVVRYRW